MGAPGAARRRQMVFCICENLEVMRFSRGFSQMRQQRRASGEPRSRSNQIRPGRRAQLPSLCHPSRRRR